MQSASRELRGVRRLGEVASQYFRRFRLRDSANYIDHHAALFVPVWVLVYFAGVWRRWGEPLWYDELLTYYGATATTLHRFITGITHFDFNPPLLYGLVRVSVRLFGDSSYAVRLPSVLAFLAAGLMLFVYVRRRRGGAYGLASIVFLWSAGFLPYATQARPYALMLALFLAALLFWTKAALYDRWTGAHLGLLAATAALFLTHCFAPLCVVPIICGELTRTRVQRRFDSRIWSALLAPFPILLIYVPLLRASGRVLYPLVREANWRTFCDFYFFVFLSLLVPFVSTAAAAVVAGGTTRTSRLREFMTDYEWMFVLSALMVPIPLISYTIHAHVPYWLRYGIAIAVPGALLCVTGLEYLARKAVGAAVVAAIILLVSFFANTATRTGRANSAYVDPVEHVLKSSALPIVAANGTTFLEMDHYGPIGIVSRLHYLTDYDAAVTYAHTTAYEEFGLLKECYPIRAKVERFETFVGRYDHFLVIGERGQPQDWMLKKLSADHWRLSSIASARYGEVFEATLVPRDSRRVH